MNFFVTPQEIYEQLTGGPGSDSLMAAQGISYNEAARELDRAARIRRISSIIDGGWQGNAADGAYGAAQPLAAAAMVGAEHLHQSQDLLDRQGGSFHRAAADVVPIPAEPPETGMLEQLTPFDTDTEKEVRQYQADAAHNIHVFAGYDNASTHNETYMPQQYDITNHSGGTMSVTGGDTINVDDDGPSGGASDGPDGGDARRPGGGSPVGPEAGWPTQGGPPGSQPGGQPPGQTSPNDYRPPPVPTYPPGHHVPAAQPPTTAAPGGLVAGLSSAFPGGPSGGSGGSSGGGAGRGGGATGGPGGGAGRSGGPGARGLGPGGGAGALAAEEAAVRRGLIGGNAAGGRGGMGQMGAPMGAGRGKGDDDTEHERKVLIEADPESTFGSDALTAPQVIGDDDYED
jgi:hypothetical protein